MHPEEALQKAVNRRDFIAGTTSGVLGVLTMGATKNTRAQQAPQQQPPAPQQPAAVAGRVFYSTISGETVQMRGFHDDTIDAYMARPTGKGKFPGVVVVHHMPGWDEPSIEITRKFAQHGYTAICPNLHFRGGKAIPEANSAAMREAGGPTDASAMGDIEGAIRHLRMAAELASGIAL